MGIETIITAAVSAAGVGLGLLSEKKRGKARGGQDVAAAGVARAEAAAERLREQKMELDARRAQRQKIREFMQARSLAVSRQTGAGLSTGSGRESSGFGGALGQVAGGLGSALTDIGQDLGIGRSLFGVNRQRAQYETQFNWYGRQAQQSNAYGELGNYLIQGAPTVGNIGSSLFQQQGYPGQTGWETQVTQYINR